MCSVQVTILPFVTGKYTSPAPSFYRISQQQCALWQGHPILSEGEQLPGPLEDVSRTYCRRGGALDRALKSNERVSKLGFCIQDVDWHAEDANMFASVGDDRKLMM